MRHRFVLGFGVFLFVAAPAIALIWTQITPVCRATAELQVAPTVPHLVFPAEDNGVIRQYEAFVNTQISIMQSPIVLNRALEQREVQETAWYTDVRISLLERLFADPLPPMERLKEDFVVRHRPETEIVEVALSDQDPEVAKLIVDAVLEEYIKCVEERSDATAEMIDDILAKLANLDVRKDSCWPGANPQKHTAR